MPVSVTRACRALTLTTAVALSLFATAAKAQPDPTALAQMGGAAQAVAEVCGGYTDAQLVEMKGQQRTAAGQMGLAPAEFDAQFQAGLAKARTDIKAAGQQKQDAMCEQMKALGGQR